MVIYFLQVHPVSPAPPIDQLRRHLLAKKRTTEEGGALTRSSSSQSRKDATSKIGNLLVEFFAFYGTSSPHGFQPFQAVLSLRNSPTPVHKRSSPLYAPSTGLKSAAEAIGAAGVEEMAIAPLVDSARSREGLEPGKGPTMTPLLVDEESDGEDAVAMVTNSLSPTWRFCIEDPFEEHDLGRVIYSMTGQIHIMNELKRAVTLFNDIVVKYRIMSSAPVERDSFDEEICDYWRQLCEENTAVPTAKKTCTMCGQIGHFSKDCDLAKCHLCSEKGHFMRDCIMLFCSNCSQQGHFAKDCKKEKICRFCKQPGHKLKFCPLRSCAKCGSHKHKTSKCPVQADAKTPGAANLLLEISEHKTALSREGKSVGDVDSTNSTTHAGVCMDDGSHAMDRSTPKSAQQLRTKKKKQYRRPPNPSLLGLQQSDDKGTPVPYNSPVWRLRGDNRVRSESVSSTGSTPEQPNRPPKRRLRQGGRGFGSSRGAGESGLSARLAGAIESKAVSMSHQNGLKVVASLPAAEDKLSVIIPEDPASSRAASKSPTKTSIGSSKYASAKRGSVDSPSPLMQPLSPKVESKVVTPAARVGARRSFGEKKGPATEIAESIDEDRDHIATNEDKYISVEREKIDLYLSDDKRPNLPSSSPAAATTSKKWNSRRKKPRTPVALGDRGGGMSPQDLKSPDFTQENVGGAEFEKVDSKFVRCKKGHISAVSPVTRRAGSSEEPVGGFFL